jgi:ABC-type transport system substrate-binding protein
MNQFDRRALFTSGAAAALLVATGVSAQTVPHHGGRLRAALSGAARSDYWGTADGAFMQAARGAVFETLTEIAGDGTLHGDIAQSWETNDGGKTWSFLIHPSVMFHDGIALHFDDLVSLFGRHSSLDVHGVSVGRTDQIFVTLNEVNHSFPYLLADPRFAVLPAQASRQAVGIGTGLYRSHRFQAGQQFIGTRVPKHRKDMSAGWFDEVELVCISAEEVRAEALRIGLVDVADISALDSYSDPEEFQLLPNVQSVQQVVRHSIAQPNVIGQLWPLDNTRMATRWWMT